MTSSNIPNRRVFLHLAGSASIASLTVGASHAQEEATRRFIAEAHRMRDVAVAAGDQPYGAVLVIEGRIEGYGASRVVSQRNPDAHAERVALWEAQRKLGRKELAGAVIFATSRPCAACQRALAEAKVSRMYVGPSGEDQGPPQAQ